MKDFTLKLQFDDEFYQELNELAENLDISVNELVVKFFEEGVALTWDAFEHEAKKKPKNKR
jgi:predicted DNA-binding ribbon-helix-helix protein